MNRTPAPARATPFLAVATRAAELGLIPQYERDASEIVYLPFLKPGNWRIGVVIKPEKVAA